MNIHIILDGQITLVDKDEYITTKTKDLQSEFGTVTEDGVRTQLDRLLAGQPWTNVIGAMIAADLPETDDLEEA